MSDIASALKSLENQIGIAAQQGVQIDTQIVNNQRKNIVSWLTIKGVESIGINTSNETLGKMYGIPRYLNSVLDNQRTGKNKYKKKIDHVYFDTDQTPPNYVYQNPKNEYEAAQIYPQIYPQSNLSSETDNQEPSKLDFNKIKSLIQFITKETVRDNIDQELKTVTKTFETKNKDLLSQVTQVLKEQLDKNNALTENIASDIAKDITEKKIKSEIELQTENLKKIIEEIIFQGYLNHRIKNENQDQILTEQQTPQSNNPNNSSFIPKIDPNYHFDTYATKVIRSALNMCENLYVFGDTGCGKTTHLEQVCAVLNRGIMRVNPHDGITREMFLGGMKLINNETIFIEGALPIAMRNGLVFLVDEISFLPPNLTAILNPIGEKGGKLYIPETSEWITPQPGFCIFATDNTGGKGDRTGNYTGTEVQNTATLDRFAFCLKMDYLPQEKEFEMLFKRFPNQDKNEMAKMLNLSKDIRLAFSRGELSITLSTRKLIKFFDQRNNNFTIEEALSNTILSWLDEDDETLVKTMIDRLQILNQKETGVPYTNASITNYDQFLDCINKSNKVEAIRIYRRVWDCDLKTAKDAVEEIMIDGSIFDQSSNKLWSERYGV